MKNIFSIMLAAGVLAGLMANPVAAQEEGKEKFRDKVYDRYDEYYDGKKFEDVAGNDGLMTYQDFINNASERDTLGGRITPEFLKRFDADGNGALTKQEAKAAKEAFWKEKVVPNAKEYKESHPNATKEDFIEKFKEHRANKGGDEGDEDLSKRERFKRFKENHPNATKEDFRRYLKSDEGMTAKDRFKKFKENHPNATKEDFRRHLREHREEEGDGNMSRRDKRIERFKENHPNAPEKLADDMREHPNKAKAVRDAVKEHPEKAKEMYQENKKKAYQQPGWAKEKANKKIRERKNR